jgi:hypothetical protein
MKLAARFSKTSTWMAVFALLVASAATQASADTFNIQIIHNINGQSLGLDKDLPVDIYVNGGLAYEDVKFKDSLTTDLEEGTYTFEVKRANTSDLVASFGPAEVPAGASVTARARLGANKTPTLDVKVR